MRRRPPAGHVRAGLLVLLVTAAGLYLAFTKSLPWSDPYEVRAVVADAQELGKGSKVRIAGVDVGVVRGVERGPAGTSIVRMTVSDAGRPLHRDATVTLRPRLFLEGNFFVDVRPGSPSAPELGDGDTIPLGQTASAVRIDSVLRILRSDVRASLREGLEEYAAALGDGGAQALNGSFDAWQPAFLGVARVTSAMRGERPGDLSGFLRGTARIAAGLARDERALGELVGGFSRTVRATAAQRDDLGATLREVAAITRQAPAGLADLERALPAVRDLARDVRPALRQAPRTLDDAQPFLAQVAGLVRPEELTGLDRDLSPALRTVRELTPELQTLLRPVGRVSGCVSENVLPVLRSEVDDGRLSTGQPVWQELLRAAVGIAGASQNFDGNGPDLRYSLGFGDQTVSLGDGPSTGDLFARPANPILGSRPQMPAQEPPKRPFVPCAGQPLPDLEASASPAPATRAAPPLRLTDRQTRALRRLVAGRSAKP